MYEQNIISYTKTMNQIVPPAELWLGGHQQLIIYAQQYVQKIFCPNNGCTTCKTCSLIKNRQYHATIWLYPDKQYTLASLEPITQTISFALDTGQHFFFIIQKADHLSHVAQNMLLKTIEEPPTGYHFLLLAERKEQLLPTIQSRCHIKTFNTAGSSTTHQSFLAFFTAQEKNPFFFLEELEKSCPHEYESIEMLDAIITYWLTQYTQSATTDREQAHKKLTLLLNVKKQPPMPGSSKLFWKNLFLQWQ